MTRKFSELPAVVKSALAEHFGGEPALAAYEGGEFSFPPLPARLADILSALEAGGALKISGFEVTRGQISRGGKSAQLTEKEYEIMKYIHDNKTATRAELLKNVWGYSGGVDTNTVETHISRLRQKISENFRAELITTRSGSYGFE